VCRNLHVVSDTILDTPVSALAALVTIFLRIPKPRARINSPPERRIARMSRLRERRGRRRRQGAKQPVDFGLCSDAAPAVDAGGLDGKSRDDLPSVCPPFGTSHKPKDAVRERFFRTESPPKMAPVRLRGHLQRFANLVVADPRRSAEARLVIKPVHTDGQQFPCWSAYPPRPERCACTPATAAR
jgi:hypothetical protein